METAFRYQTLYNITTALNALAPDAVLPELVESITKAVNAKGCSLMFFTPDKKELIHTVTYGLSRNFLEKGPIKSDVLIDEVLAGKVVMILDTRTDPRVQYREQVRKEGIASLLSIPLVPQGETIGILRIYTSEPRLFSDNDIDFLRCLTNIGSISLQKARVYETLEKSLEERCKELTVMTEEKNRFLHFLSIAAHDLKAPLTAIQSYFGVMLGGYSGELNEKQRSMIERSSIRIKELLNLISDLLDIPRIESGQLVQEMKECSLSDVISGCVAEMRGLAVQKGLILKLELPENLPEIYGSTPRLQQVISNLLNNAIVYTSQGEVVVRAAETEKGVRVEVMDTGIGILPEDQPRIFTDFFRGSNVKTTGTGLGLSITRRIIEAHSGKIWCESPCWETNTGSRFVFILPKMDEAKRKEL